MPVLFLILNTKLYILSTLNTDYLLEKKIKKTNSVFRQGGRGAGAHPLPIGENTYSPGGLDLTSCVAIPLWRLKCFLHRRRQACALALILIIA